MLDPIAFSLGFLEVRWYGLLIGMGALAGLWLAVREGKRFGLDAEFFTDILLVGLPTAVLCARLYYVLFNLDQYRSIWEAIGVWNGGLAIHGAIIGALIGGGWVIRRRGYSFWRVADICAPSLIIGQIVGRWGNFFNREAYGGPVEEAFLREGLMLPDWIVNQMLIRGVYHHPTFLYEMIWNVMGIALLFYLRRRPFVRSGELLMTYLGWYSVGRFFVEGFRTDSLNITLPESIAYVLNALWHPMVWLGFEQGALPAGNVRVAQLISVIILIAVVVIVSVRRRAGELPKYSDPITSSLKEAVA